MTTEPTRPVRLHDMKPLRDEIRSLTKARNSSVRYRLLAYGYLRGLSIRQMESPFTRDLANAATIIKCAHPSFHGRVEESEEDRAAAWQTFTEHVKTDVKTWNAECKLRVMQRDIARRQYRQNKEVA